MSSLLESTVVVTVDKDDILGAFSNAEKMSAKKHHIDAFKWVRFKASEGSGDAFFEASNGYSSIRTPLTGHEVSEDVDVYLPKRLGQIIKAMPSGPIQLEIGDKDVKIHGTAPGDTSYTLGLLAGEDGKLANPEDGPKLHLGLDIDWASKDELDAGLASALGEASQFCSGDQARQNLMSVLVIREGDEIIIGSSDSFRMYVSTMPAGDFFEEGQFSLPQSAIHEMNRTFAGGFKMAWDDNKIYISDGSMYFGTSRIHGDVPNFSTMVTAILGNENKKVVALPRNDLLAALNQVGVMSVQNQAVVLDLTDGVRLTVSNQDGHAESLVPCEVSDEGVTIAFNLGFLKDALTLYDDDTVNFHYINQMRPVVIQGQSESRSYMIAPVKI